MREGIIGQLPAALPKDKVVLVVGPENYPGLNALKSQIEEYNRNDKWIRGEFRTIVSDSQVSDKIAVLLTMFSVKRGTLANMRKAAERYGICCPNQALTVSEVKEILQILDSTRKGVAMPVQNNASNGNGAHQILPKDETRLHRDSDAQGRPWEANYVQPLPEGDEPVSAAQSHPAQNQADVESALAAIEKFGGVLEETHLAVLVVADQLKASSAECGELQTQLSEKDKEILELKTLLVNANKIAHSCGALEDENKRLKLEVARLQKTLSNVKDVIRDAQS